MIRRLYRNLRISLRAVGNPEALGHSDEIGKRTGAHLSHHFSAVRLHGDLTRPELRSDLLVQQTGDDESHHFAFARSQRRVAMPKRLDLAASIDCLVDSIEQYGIAEGLRQKFNRSRLHRLHRRRHVAVAGDEDDRHFDAIGETLLDVETMEIGKSHIEDQTMRHVNARMREELVRGSKRLGVPAGRANQQLERLADRDIVVEHKDGRNRHRRSSARFTASNSA
jgi:hypothetical protein